MRFYKYHALGNDYIILPYDRWLSLKPAVIRKICDRHFGLGGDGILWGPLLPDTEELKTLRKEAGAETEDEIRCGLRIFNPDGGEAEKSGNGLRIFSRFLFERGILKSEPVRLLTLGGRVGVQAFDGGRIVRVEMGKVTFNASFIPVAGESGEIIERRLTAGGREFVYTAANIGNPHCIIMINDPEVSLSELACQFGPEIERHELFPHRTNVQFMRVNNRRNIEIAIWERGAGYTLASGSSASACGAGARRLGVVDSEIRVNSPGGELKVEISDSYNVFLEGEVAKVADGEIHSEIIQG